MSFKMRMSRVVGKCMLEVENKVKSSKNQESKNRVKVSKIKVRGEEGKNELEVKIDDVDES